MRISLALILVLFFVCPCTSLSADIKTVPLPDVINAETIQVDDNQLYITEGASIYIYSLTDFKLKKKFGKRGEGPQEFNVQVPVPLIIDTNGKNIMVTSRAKMSLFTKDGTFINEKRIPAAMVFFIKPFGKHFTGFKLVLDGTTVYRSINILNPQLKNIKELCRIPSDFQTPGNGFNAFVPESYDVHDNKVFIPWHTGFHIDVYDLEGKLAYSIKQDYENLEVTRDHKKQVQDAFKINIQTREIFDAMKPFHYPDVMPAIREIRAVDGKVYAITYKREKGKTECYIFDLKGKLLKRTFVRLSDLDYLTLSPYTIRKGKLYQVVENDEDGWDLKIIQID